MRATCDDDRTLEQPSRLFFFREEEEEEKKKKKTTKKKKKKKKTKSAERFFLDFLLIKNDIKMIKNDDKNDVKIWALPPEKK